MDPPDAAFLLLFLVMLCVSELSDQCWVHLTPEGIDACVGEILQQQTGQQQQTQQQQQRRCVNACDVYQHVIYRSLKGIGAPVVCGIPSSGVWYGPDAGNEKRVGKPSDGKQICLQLVAAINIAMPASHEYNRMATNEEEEEGKRRERREEKESSSIWDEENDDLRSGNNIPSDSNVKRRLLLLTLTDGISKTHAIEIDPIPQLRLVTTLQSYHQYIRSYTSSREKESIRSLSIFIILSLCTCHIFSSLFVPALFSLSSLHAGQKLFLSLPLAVVNGHILLSSTSIIRVEGGVARLNEAEALQQHAEEVRRRGRGKGEEGEGEQSLFLLPGEEPPPPFVPFEQREEMKRKEEEKKKLLMEQQQQQKMKKVEKQSKQRPHVHVALEEEQSDSSSSTTTTAADVVPSSIPPPSSVSMRQQPPLIASPAVLSASIATGTPLPKGMITPPTPSPASTSAPSSSPSSSSSSSSSSSIVSSFRTLLHASFHSVQTHHARILEINLFPPTTPPAATPSSSSSSSSTSSATSSSCHPIQQDYHLQFHVMDMFGLRAILFCSSRIFGLLMGPPQIVQKAMKDPAGKGQILVKDKLNLCKKKVRTHIYSIAYTSNFVTDIYVIPHTYSYVFLFIVFRFSYSCFFFFLFHYFYLYFIFLICD